MTVVVINEQKHYRCRCDCGVLVQYQTKDLNKKYQHTLDVSTGKTYSVSSVPSGRAKPVYAAGLDCPQCGSELLHDEKNEYDLSERVVNGQQRYRVTCRCSRVLEYRAHEIETVRRPSRISVSYTHLTLPTNREV